MFNFDVGAWLNESLQSILGQFYGFLPLELWIILIFVLGFIVFARAGWGGLVAVAGLLGYFIGRFRSGQNGKRK